MVNDRGVPCPLCGRHSPAHFRTRDLNRGLSRERFSYYRCPACGLIFLSPVPDNLGDYYPSAYYGIPTAWQLAARAEGERYKVRTIQQFVRSGRLLEIGPSYGAFAYLAQQAGFEVDVIERDAACCRFLTEVVGVRAMNSTDICSALAKLSLYDVISLWQVIEHLPDPWRTLESVVGHLAPGGLLVVATPNPAALQFRLFGRFWFHLDAPRHLALIPAELLTRRMQLLGMNRAFLTTTDKGTRDCDYYGWQQSIANFFPHLPSVSPHRLVSLAMRGVGPAIYWGLRFLESRPTRGTSYTAVFLKK
jgi:2-polyprenyl-3-methyl-5-hydroxy-6-metoxy-1,4-benzoquinol methylase